MTRWQEIVKYRDYMIRDLDDSGAVAGYEKSGVTVVKGEARIKAPATITVEDRRLTAEHIVTATGSEAVIPPIEGLGDRARRRAGGIEIGQMLRRYGAGVTIV